MTESDKESFTETLRAVYALYRVEFSASVLQIWWAALQELDLAAIKGALTRHATNPDSGQFCPKPADVIRELGGTRADQSLMAWTKVLNAVRGVGGWASVQFDDPITHRVLEDMGGWVWLCENLTIENTPFEEKRFRDAYRAHLSRGVTPHHQASLPGRFEAENTKLGYSRPQPVAIANHLPSLPKKMPSASEG